MKKYIERQDPCPYCGCSEFVYRENGPHVEVRCIFCDSHLGFAPQINEERWKKMIKERANYICQRCGKPLDPRHAYSHHLLPKWFMPDRALDLSNGICLCRDCHKQVHGVCGTIREREEI